MFWFFCFNIFCGFFFVGSSSEVPASVGDNRGVCGISPAVQRYQIYNPNRVFGGENSKDGDFPWYILQNTASGSCSGTIVHERWILTAAHCFPTNWVIEKGYTANYGSANRNNMKKSYGGEFHIHPNYTTSVHNDIALVKLPKPLKFSKNVQPICLNSSVVPEDNEIMIVAGMGTGFKKRNGHIMTSIKTTILQDSPIAHLKYCDFDKKLCAGGVNHATLPGDSGGPLMVIRGNRFIQVGIAQSFAWKGFGNESLSASFTVYYSRISYFCDWIKSTTNNEVQC